jgi:hypothetical protein
MNKGRLVQLSGLLNKGSVDCAMPEIRPWVSPYGGLGVTFYPNDASKAEGMLNEIIPCNKVAQFALDRRDLKLSRFDIAGLKEWAAIRPQYDEG